MACLFGRFAAGQPKTEAKPPSSLGSREGMPVRLGDYELLEIIGRGGMGVVFKARQIAANRTVAVKLIAAGDLATPELVRRFKTEAETAAALEHPGIVPVYEVGEFEGRHFFSMRFVPGESLAARLASISRGTVPPFDPRSAAHLVGRIALAIQFAHSRGVLHRDVKPGNIMLDEHDSPCLTDFGLAKVMEQESALTKSHGLLGTPAYMAPEQALGANHQWTTAVDVYGLGAVFYHMLAGVPPFQASTSYELIRQVIENDPIRPSERNALVDLDLETICLKCLEKRPALRYPTALALAEDLERWRSHQPISARATGLGERALKWGRRHPALALLVAAALVTTLVLIDQQRRHAAAIRIERDTAREAQLRAETTVMHQRLAYADQLLQSGKTADALAEWAFLLRGDASNRVAAARVFSTLSHRNFVLPADGHDLIPIPTFTMEFSPDGRQVLVANRLGTQFLNGRTWQPLDPPRQLSISSDRVHWGSDGKRLAIANSEGARLFGFPSLEQLHPVIPLQGWSVPRFSSDGRWLAISGGEGSKVWLQDLSSGEISQWQGDHNENRRPGTAVVPTQGRFLVPINDGFQSWPMGPGEMLSPANPLRAPIRRIRDRPHLPLALLETENSQFHFYHSETLEPVWPKIDLDPTVDDDISPNGLVLATAQAERWGQLWNFAEGKPMGEPVLRACQSPRVRFDPGGQRLLLFGDTEGIHVCDAREGRMRSHAYRHAAPVTHAEYSPDGRTLATSSEDRTVRLWDAENANLICPPLIHSNAVRYAQFAAKGRFLITLDREDAVRVWNASNGELFAGPWKQDSFVHRAVADESGRWLFCANHQGWSLYSLTDPSSPPRTGDPTLKFPMAEFSADGNALLTLAVTDEQQDLVRIFDPATLQVRWSLPERRAYVRAAMTEDTSVVAVAGADAVVRLWSTATSQPVGRPMRHRDQIWVVAFRRDGRVLLTAGSDRKAQIWDTRTGNALGVPMLHESDVWQAQFGPDGTRVLTSTSKGHARIWDVNTGHPLTEPFLGHPVAVHVIMSPSTTARFSPDGRRVVLPSEDFAARLVELPPAQPPPAWLPELVEAIAGQRRQEDSMQVLAWSDLYKARTDLQQESKGGDWLTWARWLFADRFTRPLTPYSTQASSNHVGELVRENTVTSLTEALRLDPNNPAALRQLAKLWSEPTLQEFPGRARMVNHWRAFATRQDPAKHHSR